MPPQPLAVDLFGAPEDRVRQIEVALHDRDTRELHELIARGHILVAGGAEIIADADLFAAHLGLQLIEQQADGETRAIADEEVAMAILDVPARAGEKNAALGLFALGVGVFVDLRELLVGEPGDERDEKRREQKIKRHDPRIVALVGLDEVTGAVGEVGLG